MSIVIGCACATGGGNTGLPNCMTLFKQARGIGMTRQLANDGTANKIDLTATSLTNEFSGLLTESDISKRMFPITDMVNITFPKEDTQYDTAAGGQKSEIRTGIQSFMGHKRDVAPTFDLKLKQFKCKKNAVYIFTRDGVWGIRKDTEWFPIPINAFAPDYVLGDDGAVSHEEIPFDFAQEVEKGQLWLLTWDDLNTTYDDMLGLLDVNVEVVTPPALATGTVTVELALTTDYGSGLLGANPQTVDGLATADFTVTNTTTGLPAGGVAVTEVEDTKYTISYTAETPGHSMKITLDLASGYEMLYTYSEPS